MPVCKQQKREGVHLTEKVEPAPAFKLCELRSQLGTFDFCSSDVLSGSQPLCVSASAKWGCWRAPGCRTGVQSQGRREGLGKAGLLSF
jgi:hypothetical protein